MIKLNANAQIVLLLSFLLCCIESHGTPIEGPNGHYYERVTRSEGYNWSRARTEAETRYFNGLKGHLVTITSQEEQDFIYDNLGGRDLHGEWIGLHQLPGNGEPGGGWEWITGEDLIYTNWGNGEPNNNDEVEDVGQFTIHLTSTIVWNDGPRNIRNSSGYVIEYDSEDSDVCGSLGNRTPIALNSSIDCVAEFRGGGSSEFVDLDEFQIEVTEPGTLSITTTGAVDTQAYLFENIFTRASDDDSGYGTNFHIEYIADPGSYVLSINLRNQGEYSVQLTFSAVSSASPPHVITGSATYLGADSVTLNGQVNPNGQTTSSNFQWGTTTAYENNTSSWNRGAGNSTVSFNETLTGLSACTTYYYRAYAANDSGNVVGEGKSFVTTGCSSSLEPGHNDYCSGSASGTCGIGEGDCDPGQCQNGLVCVNDVGPNYGFRTIVDVCEVPSSSNTLPLGHNDFCVGSASGACGTGEGDCDNDSQCEPGLVCVDNVGANYGFRSVVDVCEVPSAPSLPESEVIGGNDFCLDNPCGIGEGDCDNHSQCESGLVCVDNVGANYGFRTVVDVCEEPQVVSTPSQDPDYCETTVNGSCQLGEGDCDPGQCGIGLVCVDDVGFSFGYPSNFDVCLSSDAIGLNNYASTETRNVKQQGIHDYIVGYGSPNIGAPDSISHVSIVLSELSADIDLWLKINALPSQFDNDCSSEKFGQSAEVCTISVKPGDQVYVRVYGFESGDYRITSYTSYETPEAHAFPSSIGDLGTDIGSAITGKIVETAFSEGLGGIIEHFYGKLA